MNNTWTRISPSDDLKNTVVYRAIFFLFLTIITQPVAATVSDCKTTDPRDVESVWHCVASYRQAPSGKNLFETYTERLSCRDLSKLYLEALKTSGISFNIWDKDALLAALPSCEFFSEITRRFTGNPSWWASCLGHPGSREHLKNCLTSSAKGYYEKGKPLSFFGGCVGIAKLYYSGLDAASNFVLWGDQHLTIEPDYQAAFEKIDCADYQAVLREQEPIVAARWATCMNYSQESKEAHLRTCIGDDIRKLNSCQRVRSLYERKIKEAAGGSFPLGYTMLDCALAESLIAEEKKRVEKERLAAIALNQARNEQRRVAQEQYRAAQRARVQRNITAPSPTLASGREGSEITGETSGSIASQWIALITFLAVLIFLWRKGIIGKLLNSFSTSDLWKMTWEKISDQDDFPNTVVYRKDGPKYKIYRVSFDNTELIVKGWRPILKSLFFGAGLLAAFPIGSFLIASGWNGTFTFFLMIGIIIVWFNKIKLPWTVKRIIELDRNTDTLRVLNEGRLEGGRKLSRMDTLTVDVHPEAEAIRLNRQERGGKGLRNEEKSHCLFGRFGIKGAEKVVLITRAEWPNYNSLSEVRLAVLWARDLAFGEDGTPDVSETADRGMKPPLD